MPILDVFNQDMFKCASLTAAINKLPYKPSRIAEMKLFAEQGVTTDKVVIEEQDGILALLPTSKRGQAGTVAKVGTRRARAFVIPHIEQEDSVLADDVLNVRKFGSENQEEAIAEVVNNRLAAMRQNHEITLEYQRIGALQGQILDADGSTVIYNLFNEFDVVEQTVDFALDVTTTNVLSKCVEAARLIEDALGASIYTRLHAFCGKNFFDALTGHVYVQDAYHRYQDSLMLRSDTRKGFEFGGITFEEYYGKIGSVSFIDANEARIFPVGVQDLFVTYFAPADMIEAVNTIGLPLYAKQERMPLDKGIRLHTQSNPLSLCLRPRCLVKATI